jgi:putative spermidine/putrescine transport system ATP-binding protein
MDKEKTKELTAALRIDGVTKRFGDVLAVDRVTLEIKEGEFLTLLGPSGSGKSTVLLMIAGFETPTSGNIFLFDRSLAGVPPYRRRIGIVFQSHALFPHLSVYENIAFALRTQRWAKEAISDRVSEMLALVRLDGLDARRPNQLSGGQQQRVALARALAFRPSVLLLDEPLGALDRKLREQMLNEFRRIHRTLGTTMVFVTHDQEEALALSDRIAVMESGAIVRDGTPRELYEDPGHNFIADFIGEANIVAGTATDAETVRVGDGDTSFSVAHGKSRGASVQIAVRPEKIMLGSPDEGSNVTTGVVENVLYLGETTKYEVRTAWGQVLLVKQINRYGSVDYDVNSTVTMWWRPEDCRVLWGGK